MTAIKNKTIARQLFPYWDEPALEATFKISVKHQKKYQAFSNIPNEKIIHEKFTEDDQNDMIWTHFKNSSFMPVQHLKIVIIYGTVIFSHANVTFWCEWNMKQYIQYATYIAKEVLNFLKRQKVAIEIPEINYVVLDTEHSFETREIIFQR